MTWIALGVVLWPVLALAIALVLGPAIGLADRQAEDDVQRAARSLVEGVERELARLAVDPSAGR